MEPIKIIYKYKNNNSRIQYHVYIFTGDVPNNVMTILKKIQDMSLYDALTEITDSEQKILIKQYGEKWYNSFYNTYHINYSIDEIKKNKKNQTDLINKFGEEWYNNHIKQFELIDRKILYTYTALIKDEIIKRELKRKKIITEEEEEEMDYTTTKPITLKTLKAQLGGSYREESAYTGEYAETVEILDEMATCDYNLFGGFDDDNDDDDDDEVDVKYSNRIDKKISRVNKDLVIDTDEDENVMIDDIIEQPDDEINLGDTDETLNKEADEDGDGVVEFDEGLDQEVILEDEEMELDDLEKIYQDNDVMTDPKLTETSNLIKQALNDDKIFKKSDKHMAEFDTDKDNVNFDENLKNVYKKHYVTGQYIFKDDTIKTLKSKICTSIRNNPKFDSDGIIPPSRQYLWSEYIFEEKLERIMIGQKWIRRSDLLNIDVEPNVNMRFYQELRGNLKILRDNIRRYGSKIKREDDDFNILYDYEGYYMNNEIFMIDVYNELGKGFNTDAESLRNIEDVYIKIYFPRIKHDDIKHIVDYVNGDTKVEVDKSKNIYDTLIGDLIIEKEIMHEVEKDKKIGKYKELFKDNYVTQSTIHVNLRVANETKIDLFRIFNEFITTNDYPFIQYQTIDGNKIYKWNMTEIERFTSNKKNTDLLTKWFERAPYGISVKVRIKEKDVEKFMAIDLSETGRIEYKTQWKEENMATIEDIKGTYIYIRNLIEKINSESKIVKFELPQDFEFKYAFINTIQKFELPGKHTINHNDLSEFARYFYPYVALVVEPCKRQSKLKKSDEKGKYGTYLCYKRISKYENQGRIEQRILYFIRNYDYTDQMLANEISKQFNLTLERAVEEIERVKNKNPYIKKSRKILKKLENIPKYKTPGIRIDIQGKQRDRYKIRVSGARNKEQLDRIISFYGVLIYLYAETYLLKNPEKQYLKEKLKNLTKIAKRRNKVDEIVDYDKEKKNIKQMASVDKQRIGFKPEKGENQYSRSCQNSGTDKKRQPHHQYTALDDLLRQGFKFNKTTGLYEKKVILKGKKEVVIRAVGLDNLDDGNPTGTVYYACDPNENGEHMFIGFLSKSSNPYGQCMPCCFKKDAYTTTNKEKKDYFMKCIGQKETVEKVATKQPIGEKLYILQDTNKIQEGKYGFLPKYLDYYLNQMQGKIRKYKDHYLLSSDTGYYFKYGSKQEENNFLNSCAAALDMELSELKNKIISSLTKDKNDMLFTALNNGDIKTSFGKRDKYIEFIQNSSGIKFEAINHIMTIPGVITPNGLNIIIFKKETTIIKKTLEKENIKDDFITMCQNIEEIDNIKDINRDNIILLKENKNYNPIINIKKNKTDVNFVINKIFKYEIKNDNIINHIYDFYKRGCETDIIGDDVNHINAKIIYKQLIQLNKDKYIPHSQMVDTRNKCKYIITKNSTVIPVKQSGSIYDLPIIKTITNKIQSFDETLDRFNELANDNIKVKPIGIYYDIKRKDDVNIVGIMTELYELVPITPIFVNMDIITKKGFITEYKQMYDYIDIDIAKGKDNFKIDDRISTMAMNKYEIESYELFRLHLSHYLNKPSNEIIKNKIIKIVSDQKTDKAFKRNIIKGLLFRLIDKNLKKLYDKMSTPKQDGEKQDGEKQDGGKHDRLLHVINKRPNLTNYEINNDREMCYIHKSKEECFNNKHCHWAYDECNFALTRDLIITFVNKVSEEFINNDHKAAELLQRDNYFVSDIVDYNNYKERDNQKIIKSSNIAINKALHELFGKDNLPIIGKKKLIKTNDNDLKDLNMNHTLKSHADFFIQSIIPNNISLLRAYANAYNWIKHTYYDLTTRNLGYYNNIQTDMANFFRGVIIDWITEKNNYTDIITNLKNYMDINKKSFIDRYIHKLNQEVMKTTGVVELYILNKKYGIPIIVYDQYNTIIYIFDKNIIYDKFITNSDINDKKYDKYKDIINLNKYIHIRYASLSTSNIPMSVEVIYYK